jgi:hypothetical protein
MLTTTTNNVTEWEEKIENSMIYIRLVSSHMSWMKFEHVHILTPYMVDLSFDIDDVWLSVFFRRILELLVIVGQHINQQLWTHQLMFVIEQGSIETCCTQQKEEEEEKRSDRWRWTRGISQ